MKIKLVYSFGIIVQQSIWPACCSNKRTKLAQIQAFWLVGWLVTMALGASWLVLPLGPILVRFFRITGQNLARKMENLGAQISTNAHNRHCVYKLLEKNAIFISKLAPICSQLIPQTQECLVHLNSCCTLQKKYRKLVLV